MKTISFENLGTVNKNKVSYNGANGNYMEIYFSYATPVSIRASIGGQFENFTRQNDWSTTTGKLLNECEPDKSKRIAGEQFEQKLAKILAKFN
jgi:hypothetical protein